MANQDFARIEVALEAVGSCAGRLPPGNAEASVQRSVRDLCLAFTSHAAVEPEVERLMDSLQRLHAVRLTGHRRVFQRDAAPVGRLVRTVEQELLPALRRVGFKV